MTRSGGNRDFQIAADIVERARAGDQNAMASIAMTRESAPSSPRALQMLRAILGYCKLHPASESAPSFEADGTLFDPAIQLALGKLRGATLTTDVTARAITQSLIDAAYAQDPLAYDIAAYWLSQIAPIDKPLIDRIAAELHPDIQEAFKTACCGFNGDESHVAIVLGDIVHRARALRFASEGHFALLNGQMAAELGG